MTTNEHAEQAHLVTDPQGNTFVACSGADVYQSARAKAQGYKVEKVEGHAEKHGFKITKKG